MQTPCGHRFCSACILRALRETGPRCPVDNTRVAVHQLFKDNFAKREVLSLHVCCHANEQGCSWQGELRKLETHEKVCSLISMQCPNECGHQCQRKDLYEHLPNCPNQSVPCHSCSISFVKSKFESHTQFCSKIKLPDSTLSDIAKVGYKRNHCIQYKCSVVWSF
jgi:TNF receptor-associated factor 6